MATATATPKKVVTPIAATVVYRSGLKHRKGDNSPYISHRLEALDGQEFWKSLDQDEALVTGTQVQLIPYWVGKKIHHQIVVIEQPRKTSLQQKMERWSTEDKAAIEADIDRF